MFSKLNSIQLRGAGEHNLKNLDACFPHQKITVVTGVSGSGKSSLVFDTILVEAQRRFFYTLSHYSRQFLSAGTRPAFRQLSGLSPAIGLAQNETIPSSRASVGTLTELTELLGVMFARFGLAHCPLHMLPTVAQNPGDIAKRLMAEKEGELVFICAPVATQKKGSFQKILHRFSEKGYLRVLIDGKLLPLSPLPDPDPKKRHDVSLVIDHLRISSQKESRLLRSLDVAAEEGQGFIECSLPESNGKGSRESLIWSLKGGCSECQYSWPPLDPRYFSPNSLGACGDCRGRGLLDSKSQVSPGPVPCSVCQGTGLNQKYSPVLLGDKPVTWYHGLNLNNLFEVVKDLRSAGPAFERVRSEILKKISMIGSIGLGYLQLCRRLKTLSGGELQRLKLANMLGENLRGVLYILDEPGQGLHPSELSHVMDILKSLRDRGNTIIMVDHHPEVIREADWIIDMGPGGGPQGGRITGMFHPGQAQAFRKQSLTAEILCEASDSSESKVRKGGSNFIFVRDAKLHNLKVKEARFLEGAINVVCGVSGSGKSSLVFKTLAARASGYSGTDGSLVEGLLQFETIEIIDRNPLARSSFTMPATWLNVFTPIRKMFGALPDAQINGLREKDFSLLSKGGRCETCQGRGQIVLQMKFLSDAAVTCGECQGKRYNSQVLGVRYRGLSIAETLSLTIEEAIAHFGRFPKICRKLSPAAALGLSYLRLGQPGSCLSGGESQRLRLAPYLGKSPEKKRLLILDEPSRGLHFSDVRKLISAFREVRDRGGTIIMVDHHKDILAAADWVLEMGPGAAEAGGLVLHQGTPGI